MIKNHLIFINFFLYIFLFLENRMFTENQIKMFFHKQKAGLDL